MTLKAYKYRLYPNKTQVNYLNEVFGSVRFVWNQLVANFNSYSKDGPVRKWTCTSCGTTHDRDLNAATNILNRGLNDLYDFKDDELDAYKRSDTLIPLVEYQRPIH